ncbi:MAG: hypothetical protein WC489_00775 [Patescibacteria group bacterium]
MKTLEHKILKKVYVMETRNTLFSIASKLAIFLAAGFVTFLFIQIMIEIFTDEASLNIFPVFFEGSEVMRTHLTDILYILFSETPPEIFMIIGVGLCILLITIYVTVRNIKKMKNVIHDLIQYWEKTVLKKNQK